MNKKRTISKVLVLACAALMLALLVTGGAFGQMPGNSSGHAGQFEILQNATGMSADAGMPSSGLSRKSTNVLKANTFTAYVGASSGSACRTIAGKPLGFFSAAFRRVLPLAHIFILYESFGTPAGCRAPPSFSRL